MYILVLHVINTLLLLIPFEVISQGLQHPPLPLNHHVTFEPHDVLDDLDLQVLGEDGGERHFGHGAREEADLAPGARADVVHLYNVSGGLVYLASNLKVRLLIMLFILDM